MTAKTQTFTYPCGHKRIVRIDGRKHRGGVAAMRTEGDIRAGRKCVACRRREVQARLSKHPPDKILRELMQLVALSDVECVADVLEGK